MDKFEELNLTEFRRNQNADSPYLFERHVTMSLNSKYFHLFEIFSNNPYIKRLSFFLIVYILKIYI